MRKSPKAISLLLTLVLALTLLAIPRHADAANASSLEMQMLSLVNEDRARYGLPPLILDPTLSAIARIKAEDMLNNGYFAHKSPTYGNMKNMLKQFGVSYAGASENIARSRSIYHAEAAFLSSSTGHRQALLGKSWTHIGIGVAVTEAGFVYVSQVFVRY
ncbi:MAG: hypothetical protein IJC48_11685 [Clostridia bacterium]|nr:hypothetical protein [Clostridia bacterium]